MGETMPSENEWMIMEILWKQGRPLTAKEIIDQLKGVKDVSPKTIRVLINRLLKKGMIAYEIDERDARIYHYMPVKTKEACLEEKSKRFFKSYFGGNPMGMVAALVRNDYFSEEQINELIQILKEGKAKENNEGE